MITVYQWDEQRIFAGAVDVDPDGPMPPRSTPQPPPEVVDSEVAQWSSGGWRVLPEYPQPVLVVPAEVTMRQARLALLSAGVLASAEAAINAMAGPEGEAARIEWNYSSVMRRDKPFVNAIGGLLGLSSQQIDELFVAASNID